MAELIQDDVQSEEKYSCDLQRILNKATPGNLKKCMQSIVGITNNVESKEKTLAVLLFKNGVCNPTYSEMFAHICYFLCQAPQKQAGNFDLNRACFKEILFEECNKEFANQNLTRKLLQERKCKVFEVEDKNKAWIKDIELDERSHRERMEANVKFIGKLFKLKVIPEHIMYDCFRKLLQVNSIEFLQDQLYCLSKLLMCVGKTLNSLDKDKFTKVIFELEKVSKEMAVTRIKFSLQDVLDCHNNNWVPRKSSGKNYVKKKTEQKGRPLNIGPFRLPASKLESSQVSIVKQKQLARKLKKRDEEQKIKFAAAKEKANEIVIEKNDFIESSFKNSTGSKTRRGKKYIAAVQTIMAIYFHNAEKKLLLSSLKALKCPHLHHLFVEHSILIALDKPSEYHRLLGVVFLFLLQEGFIKPYHIYRGLTSVLQNWDELKCDFPRMAKNLGKILQSLVFKDVLSLSKVKEILISCIKEEQMKMVCSSIAEKEALLEPSFEDIHVQFIWLNPISKAEHLSDEEEKLQSLQRNLRILINTITAEKLNEWTLKLAGMEINSNKKFQMLVDLILNSAVEDTSFALVYAYMCKGIQYLFSKTDFGRRSSARFMASLGTAIGDRCSKELKETCSEIGLQGKFQAEQEHNKKVLKRLHGVSNFITELFVLEVVSEKVMLDWMIKLLHAEDASLLEFQLKLSMDAVIRAYSNFSKTVHCQTLRYRFHNLKESNVQLNSIGDYYRGVKAIIDQKGYNGSLKIKFTSEKIENGRFYLDNYEKIKNGRFYLDNYGIRSTEKKYCTGFLERQGKLLNKVVHNKRKIFRIVSKHTVEEYLYHRDLEVLLRVFHKLNCRSMHHFFVEESLNVAISKLKPESFHLLGNVLWQLLEKKYVDKVDLYTGFSVIAKQCADLVVDVPFIYKFIGELLGVMAYGEDICLGIVKGDTQHNKSDLQRSENPVTQLKNKNQNYMKMFLL